MNEIIYNRTKGLLPVSIWFSIKMIIRIIISIVNILKGVSGLGQSFIDNQMNHYNCRGSVGVNCLVIFKGYFTFGSQKNGLSNLYLSANFIVKDEKIAGNLW
jgi:hypothetical protein